jgi:hypothetical protein
MGWPAEPSRPTTSSQPVSPSRPAEPQAEFEPSQAELGLEPAQLLSAQKPEPSPFSFSFTDLTEGPTRQPQGEAD